MKRFAILLISTVLLSGCFRSTPVDTAVENAQNSVVALEKSLTADCKTESTNAQLKSIKSSISEIKENWDGDIVWITPADYKTADRFVCSGKRNISEVGYKSCGTTLVPSGSIVFSKRAPIGTVAIANVELCTNQGCLSCVPGDDSCSTYYYYVMTAFTDQFNLLGTGTTFKEISYDNFGSFRIPHPNYREQFEIAAYLDDKTIEIDRLISRKEILLSELESYKKSLIYEYVTGKKEVQ